MHAQRKDSDVRMMSGPPARSWPHCPALRILCIPADLSIAVQCCAIVALHLPPFTAPRSAPAYAMSTPAAVTLERDVANDDREWDSPPCCSCSCCAYCACHRISCAFWLLACTLAVFGIGTELLLDGFIKQLLASAGFAGLFLLLILLFLSCCASYVRI